VKFGPGGRGLTGSIELAVAFDRAAGGRLEAAARLVRSFPHLFGDLLLECDIGYRRASQFFVAVGRLAAQGYRSEERTRLAFWCARAGGRTSSLSAMSERERAAFQRGLQGLDVRTLGVPPTLLPGVLDRVLAEAGAAVDGPPPSDFGPVLAIDVGGPGWAGVTYEPAASRLFVPGAIAPPLGDSLSLSLRVPGCDRPLPAKARVAVVRGADAAGPGSPAGYFLALEAPDPLLAEALTRSSGAADPAPQRRAAPRYPVRAPVRIGTASPRPASDPVARVEPVQVARIEYENDEELASDYLENLSQGGAFVRTASPAAMGARLFLELHLPGGALLRAPATVVFTGAAGMGVKFDLDAASEEQLAAVIARISARPRRALVVDDDALMRRMLADALSARGFEALSAPDARTGLRTVMEELLSLDLLVTDLRMPGMDGEAFVRTIRQAGGETELAIVAAVGSLDPEAERRLEAAGCDAVLDKVLGPELLAQAADAALERKRAGARA
jgi:CheY-like chemotaxis protein/Tfp pilus assembly protein PilZ